MQNNDKKAGVFYLAYQTIILDSVLPVFPKAFTLQRFTDAPRIF
jgi:hypothetical protein